MLVINFPSIIHQELFLDELVLATLASGDFGYRLPTWRISFLIIPNQVIFWWPGWPLFVYEEVGKLISGRLSHGMPRNVRSFAYQYSDNLQNLYTFKRLIEKQLKIWRNWLDVIIMHVIWSVRFRKFIALTAPVLEPSTSSFTSHEFFNSLVNI